MIPSILAAFFGALVAGRYLAATQGDLGLPALTAPAFAFAVLAVLAALASIQAALLPAGSRHHAWRIPAYGAIFLLLLLRPLAEGLRLPEPHDLLERKRQILFAAAGVAILVAFALEQVWAFRARLLAGSKAGFWPVIIPLVWLLLSSVWTSRWNMTGDAPHYLLITHSLVQDGDLDLVDEHRDGEAAAFYPRMPLMPQDAVVHGRMISWHKPGLSLILAPAYAAGGAAASIATVCLLTALLAGGIWALLSALGIPLRDAWWAWAAVVLSPPFFTQGAMVLTEAPAALCLCLGLWGLLRLDKPTGSAALGFSLAFLPWLNSRFLIFLPVLGLALLLRRSGRRPTAAWAWGGLALGFGVNSAFNYYFFGDPSPSGGLAAMGTQGVTFFNLSNLRFAFLGQMWDQEFGLAFTAPLTLLAVAGLVWGTLRRQALAWELWGLVAVNFGVLCLWNAWQGQMSPNRFYTPLLPVLAIGLAWMSPVKGWASRWAWWGLLSGSVVLSWVYTALPWFAFNRGDGANWILKIIRLKLHVDLSAWLPSFQDPKAWDFATGILLSAGLCWALWRVARASNR